MHATTTHLTEGPVAGVDEAGRGPLAGPVVAAAVILPRKASLPGLRDSKKLSASQREDLLPQITRTAIAVGVGWADPAEVDAINILNATLLAMRRSIIGLSVKPTMALVDGNRLPNLDFDDGDIRGEAIIGGDDKVLAISAASVVAKTTRDRMMAELDTLFPAYGFASHKGYGSKLHREQIQREGPCSAHRFTFRPVSAEWPALCRWRGTAGSLRGLS
ncbi:MAG: ribonuclease HII [Woeseiaceae bacterium]|nr:ribonuclease HII [Woeseiaceae bacterium]